MHRAIKQLINENRLVLKSDGISMLPLLQPGDMTYFNKISFRKIKINDLILIDENNKLFTHRVIYKTKKYFISKGDNNLKADGKIYPRQAFGIVKRVNRGGKIIDPENIYLIQSTIYFQEILKIQDELNRNKINHVFLKGLPLYLAFKKKHPDRIYLDCDVLVKKNCFILAEKILLRNGYKKAVEDISTDGLSKNQVECAYFKNINGFPVVFDIHSEVVFLMTKLSQLNNLYSQVFIDRLTNELLAKRKRIKINGIFFFFPSADFLVLYLALHIFHHNFLGAFRYDLLNSVILKNKSRKVLWESVNQIVQDYRLNNFVYPVFVLLGKYYSLPPAFFIKKIHPADSKYPKRLNKINIFNDETRFQAGITRIKNIFFLSPGPWYKKLFVLFNPSLFIFIFRVFLKKLFYFFSGKK